VAAGRAARDRGRDRAAGIAAAAVALAEPLAWLPPAAAAAAVPGAAVAAALGAVRVNPRRLRQIGWTLVVADAATLVLLVAAFR